MFAGFLHFSDLAEISVRHDLLETCVMHMTIVLPKSKTDQGHIL